MNPGTWDTMITIAGCIGVLSTAHTTEPPEAADREESMDREELLTDLDTVSAARYATSPDAVLDWPTMQPVVEDARVTPPVSPARS